MKAYKYPVFYIMDLFGTMAAAGINNDLAAQRERKAREANYIYGELSANNADARTRALYNDIYSPAAQIRQLKEAGLSPSIYASGGLAGKSGTSGAQGTGAQGLAPNVYGISALEAAQIQNIKANTNKTNAETENIQEETGLIKLQQITTELNNQLTQEGMQFNLDILKNTANKINSEYDLIVAQTKEQGFTNKLFEETFDARKQSIIQESKNLVQEYWNKVAEEELTKSKKSLTDAQVKEVNQRIAVMVEEIINMQETRRIYEKSVDEQNAYWDAVANNLNEQIQVEYRKIGVDIQKTNATNYLKSAEITASMLKGTVAGKVFGDMGVDYGKNINVPQIK